MKFSIKKPNINFKNKVATNNDKHIKFSKNIESVVLPVSGSLKTVYIDPINYIFIGEEDEFKPVGEVHFYINSAFYDIFVFSRDKTDFDIYTAISGAYEKTSFIYKIYREQSYAIAIVISKSVYDQLNNNVNPDTMVPLEIVRDIYIAKKNKNIKILDRIKDQYVIISSNSIFASDDAEEIEKKIDFRTYAASPDILDDFDNIQLYAYSYNWKTAKNYNPSQYARYIEFVFPMEDMLNLSEKSFITINKKSNVFPLILKYGTSIVLAFLLGIGVRFALKQSKIFKVSYTPVNIQIPKSLLSMDNISIKAFIYQKGYPYTLYEIYKDNVKVGWFVDKRYALEFIKKHPAYTLYATTYNKDGSSTRQKLGGK